MLLYVSGVTRPCLGGSAQMLIAETVCVAVLTACGWRRFHCNLHAVNTHPTQALTPNGICAEPLVDGRVTPETYRGIVSSQNKLGKVYQVGVD
jgi:hypothetical protein